MFETTHENIQRAVLVGVDTGAYDLESSLDELAELAVTAGAEVIGRVTQNRESVKAKSYIGEGKLQEIKTFCVDNKVELLIFDDELSGTQIRNIEDITGIKAVDRTTLILDIFAQRAISAEGKLQVELAQQRYLLPRLVGMGASLSRLAGGIGTRGPGESKLESDRRHIRRRIEALERELKEVESRRSNIRARRHKNNVPTIAIVGYTNSGKSTLLNHLTDSDILAENMLFATLDPTARELRLPNGQSSVIIDTVGLIRRLPHKLVEAFKSTLEEAATADVILNVVDISDEHAREHIDVTLSVLSDLDCIDTPIVTVYNKCDLATVPLVTSQDDIVFISAKTGRGIDTLLTAIIKKLDERITNTTITFPYNKLNLLEKIRLRGKVNHEEYTNDGVVADITIEKSILGGILKDMES